MHTLLNIFIEPEHPLQRLVSKIKGKLLIPKHFNYHFLFILTHLSIYLLQLLHPLHFDSLDFIEYIDPNIPANCLDPYHPNINATAARTFKAVASVAFALRRRVRPLPYLDVITINFNFDIEARYALITHRLQLIIPELD